MNEEKYEEFVNFTCEMLGLNKPIDILKLCQLTSDFIRPYEMKIKELEKENAELKEKLEIEQNARSDWFGKAVTKDRQLTEAKEIIRMYYLYNPSNKYSYEEIEQKAETFFKELAE